MRSMARASCVGLAWGAVMLVAAVGCGSSKSSSCLTAPGNGGGGAAGRSGVGGEGGRGGGKGGSTAGGGGGIVPGNGGAGGAPSVGGSAGGATSNGGAGTGSGGASSGGAAGAGGHGDPCSLAASYAITGEVVDRNIQQALLSPPATFQVTLNRYPSQIQIAACAPPLPACHAASAIDVSDVTAALDNADVQAAFAQSLMTQYEQAGAQAIQIRRTSDDHTIGEMSPCTAPACKPAPDGVRVFIALLKDLMKQQLADPSCEAVRQP